VVVLLLLGLATYRSAFEIGMVNRDGNYFFFLLRIGWAGLSSNLLMNFVLVASVQSI